MNTYSPSSIPQEVVESLIGKTYNFGYYFFERHLVRRGIVLDAFIKNQLGMPGTEIRSVLILRLIPYESPYFVRISDRRTLTVDPFYNEIVGVKATSFIISKEKVGAES